MIYPYVTNGNLTFQECSLQLIELYCVRQFHVLLERMLHPSVRRNLRAASLSDGHLRSFICTYQSKFAQDLKNTAFRVRIMGIGYKLFARPILALQDSEKAHKRSLIGLRALSWTFIGRMLLRILYKPKNIDSELFELNFHNPLGLAAGMDKKAEAMIGWETLGFGLLRSVESLSKNKMEIPNLECSVTEKILRW